VLQSALAHKPYFNGDYLGHMIINIEKP